MTLAPLGMEYSPMLQGKHRTRWFFSPAVPALVEAVPCRVSPGVSQGHVWDEQGGHRTDTQHFTDGGLQVGQQWAVAEVGVTCQANLLVNLLLDLPLHLGGEQGLGLEP